jgi:hypothetical protein
MGFIRHLDEKRGGVCFGVNGDDVHPEPFGCPNDATRDLAAIGDQDTLKHDPSLYPAF